MAIPSAAKYITSKFPFTLTYGGAVNHTPGSTVGQGAYGYFWSTDADSTTVARYLAFNGSDVYPTFNYSKSRGQSVR